MDQTTMFDVEPIAAPADPDETPAARMRRRQLTEMARGQHPLVAALGTHIPLHPDAAPADDRDARGRRCGSCAYRVSGLHNDRRYPKCTQGWQYRDGAELGPPARVTRGPGTDVRAWWPACADHEYGDPQLSADAARYVPSAVDGPR